MAFTHSGRLKEKKRALYLLLQKREKAKQNGLGGAEERTGSPRGRPEELRGDRSRKGPAMKIISREKTQGNVSDDGERLAIHLILKKNERAGNHEERIGGEKKREQGGAGFFRRVELQKGRLHLHSCIKKKGEGEGLGGGGHERKKNKP